MKKLNSSFLDVCLKTSVLTSKTILLKHLRLIRRKCFIQVWYLTDGGRITLLEGTAVTSYRGLFKLIWIKQADSDRKFGFVPTSPRLLLVRLFKN
jgi:hypothetical protein